MIEIVMYTKENCPNCKRAKFMFETCPVDVKVIEKNIETNEEFKNELVNKYNSMTLPTLVFNKDEGERYYIGFEENLGKIQEELGL